MRGDGPLMDHPLIFVSSDSVMLTKNHLSHAAAAAAATEAAAAAP